MSMRITVKGRPYDRWRSIVDDLVTPAPETDWARRVAETRIRQYDRVRASATRSLLLLIASATAAVLPDTPWQFYLLLLPAVVQITVEVYGESASNHNDEDAPAMARYPRLVRRLVHLNYVNNERILINVGGLVGTVAVISLSLGYVFIVGPDGPGWLKVTGLVACVLYANSGVLGPLADVTVYSPLQRTPMWLRRVRPFLWVAMCAVAAGVVAVSVALGRWDETAVPYAYLVCALPAGVGYRLREYERTIDCCGTVAAEAINHANRRAAIDLHNLMQPFKAPLDKLVAEDATGQKRAELLTFIAVMRATYERARRRDVDLQNGIMPTLEHVAYRSFGVVTLRPAPVVDIKLSELDGPHTTLAQQVLTVLGDNAAQGYDREPGRHHRPLRITADVVEGLVRIEVSDALDLVPDDVWDDPRRTLVGLRHELERLGGSLLQRSDDAGGKTISATWKLNLQPLRRAHSPKQDDLEGGA